MENLLPFVTNEVGHSVAQSLDQGDDKKNCEVQLKRIKKTNPAVAEFIRRWSKTCKDKIGAMMCGILVYKLLESQAEADRMNKEYE